MFKATVVASKLREQMAHYLDLVRDDEVVQVLHRGGGIKVLMTQEHYLNLLSRLALYERSADAKTVPRKSPREIESTVRARLQEHNREVETRDDSGRMGRKRTKQA